jgi:hypothetical protein
MALGFTPLATDPLATLPAAGGAATVYTLTASAGGITYQGIAATLALSRKITASAGSVVYQGIAASLTKLSAGTFILTANAGSIAYQGIAATFKYSPVLVASAGSIVYQGVSARLFWSGETVTPEGAAQLYGGGALHKAREPLKREEELTLAEKVEVISLTREGKERIAAVLPKERRPEAPALVPIEALVREVEAVGAIATRIDQLYERVLDEDDNIALAIIFGAEGDYMKH